MLLHDLRLALRTFTRNPAFALTTVAVLALGIGANTAIFGLVNQVLLRPEGISDPDQVVAVRARYEKLNLLNISVSVPDFQDAANGRTVFESVAIMREGDFNYSAGESPERLQGASVSLRWFDVFGAVPALGRTFRPEEDQPNANNVVVLAHAAWARLFGADPGVVGRTITLNQKPYKVVGVMKPDFRWPRRVDVWAPLGLPASAYAEDNRFNESYTAVARLRRGTTAPQADAYMRLAANRVKSGTGENAAFARDARWSMFALPMIDFVAEDTRGPMLVLMAAVAFVLLIACANVAGLMVARAAARSREIAVRSALGASGGQMIGQMLSDSLVLSGAGAVVGVGLAYLGTDVLLRTAPAEAVTGLTTRLDLPVLLFALAATVISALLSAAAPAWQIARVQPYEHLKSGGRSGTHGRSRQRLRSLLVVGETALALVLLVGAGLMLRSLARLHDVDPGFEPQGVLTASLSLPQAQYGTPAKQVAFFRAVTDRLASAPGVVRAGIGIPLPFSGSDSMASFDIEGRPSAPGEPGPHGKIRFVSPAYFATLGIRLKAGRVFTEQDRSDTVPVAVIDENLARQYWPGENAVGRRIRNGGSETPWATVVGVVAHVKHGDLARDPAKGTYYYSMFQHPVPFGAIVVKVARPELDAAALVRRAVQEVDPGQPVHTIKWMTDVVESSLATRRFAMRLLAFFAAIALVMAALGLYGVISYSVTQRTAEIGVRLALGAQRGAVLWLVVRNGLALGGMGVAIGVVAALAGSRVIESQLYGVSPFDLPTFAAMIAALLGAALLASYLPAHRATRVDPLIALRTE